MAAIDERERDRMKTSVVIATYNGSRFIQEQLDSIINQTVLPDEIVISDDGSTDSTVELVQSFFNQHADLPIKYQLVLNNRDNHGVRGNFENTVNHSSGEYVFFCDQDDVWLPNKIERLVNVLDSCNEQVVIHNAQVLKEFDDGTFRLIDKHLMNNYPFDSKGMYKIDGSVQVWPAFYCNCVIQGMCSCIKRDYLLSVSPFSKAANHDEWILFCAIADNTLLAIKDDLAYYRIHRHNTAGIPEFKEKRSLWEKIWSYDQVGKESVRQQYLWYADASSYLGERSISDDRVKLLISFFSKKRVTAISKGKINAICDLIKAYHEGAYEIDRAAVFFHDIFFVMMHSHKTRRQFIETFQKEIRPQK